MPVKDVKIDLVFLNIEKMGIFNSKNKFMNAPYLPPQTVNPTQPVVFEDESLMKLRTQLHTDPETFLLNNLLLSVQFFENYDL